MSSTLAEHEFEHGLGEARQRQEVGGADDHGGCQHGRRGGPVGERAAEEIADGQRDQHGGDQRGPGIDAAAEIGVEIARSQHLEAHDDRPGDEGDRVDHRRAGHVARGRWWVRRADAPRGASVRNARDGQFRGDRRACPMARPAPFNCRDLGLISGPAKTGLTHAFSPACRRRPRGGHRGLVPAPPLRIAACRPRRPSFGCPTRRWCSARRPRWSTSTPPRR